jgi:hypothetical protein
MAETLGSSTVSTKLERIAKLAREMPQAALTTLAHHIDIDWLREAYCAASIIFADRDDYFCRLPPRLISRVVRPPCIA